MGFGEVRFPNRRVSTKGFTSWRGLFGRFGAVRFLQIVLQEWVDEELDQLENI